MKIVIRITVIFGTIAFSICAFLSWRCMVKHGERKRKSKRNSGGKVKLQELPAVFSLHSREQFILLKIKKITIRIYMKEKDHIYSTQLPLSIAAQGSRATALDSPFLFLSSHIFLSIPVINGAFIYRLQCPLLLLFCQ